jgi:V/A-type H+-transporting ATPase subunit C
MEDTVKTDVKKYELSDDSSYFFTCAELKAREYEFIDNSKLERMAASDNTDDFLKTLSETFYAGKINLIDEERDMDVFLLKSYKEIADFLFERLRDRHKSLIYLLFLEEYLHDFKLGLKSLILNSNLENLFIPLDFSYDELMDFLKKESIDADSKNTGLFLKIINYMLELKKEFQSETVPEEEKSINFRKTEIAFEKKYISFIIKEISNTGSRMLTDYLKHWIDIQNIKNINRVKFAGEDLKYDDFLYPGGFIDSDFFKSIESKDPDYLAKALEKTAYREIAIKGTRSLYSYESFFSFEKNESIFNLRFFDHIKYSVSNPEKIFAFFLRKKTELIVLNMIYMGIKYHAEKRNIQHKAEFLSES